MWGEQRINLTSWSRGKTRQDIIQPLAETNVVRFAGGRERVENCQTLSASFASGKKTVFPDDSDPAVKSLGRIVVDIKP